MGRPMAAATTGASVPRSPALVLALPQRKLRPLLAALRQATFPRGRPRQAARGPGHGLVRRGQRRKRPRLVPRRTAGPLPVVPRPRRRSLWLRPLRPLRQRRRRLLPPRPRLRRPLLVLGRPRVRRSLARLRLVARVAQVPGPRVLRPRGLVARARAEARVRVRVARVPVAPVVLVPRVLVPPVRVARRAARRGRVPVLDRGLATTRSARTPRAWARPRAATAQSAKTGRRVVTALSVASAPTGASASQATAATAVRVRVSPVRRVLVPAVLVAVALAAPARPVALAG